jgi:hypothetical protein
MFLVIDTHFAIWKITDFMLKLSKCNLNTILKIEYT